MNIVIPDDYQHAVERLDCFALLAEQEVTVYTDIVDDLDTLVERFQSADALVLIRERTKITAELLARLPNLKLISQTGRGWPMLMWKPALGTGWRWPLAAASHMPRPN